MNDDELQNDVQFLKKRVQELGYSMYRTQIVMCIIVVLSIIGMVRGCHH